MLGMGTKRTPGTTIFSLEGAVKNAGLVEVPFGISLHDLIYEIGGGVIGDRPLKAVQAGGASRGCIPPSMLKLAIDTEDRPGETLMIGTGGIIVLDDTACMVDMTRFLVDFFLDESCGRCAPCREGTRQMSRILDRICEGKGTDGGPGSAGAAGPDAEIGVGVRTGQHGPERGADEPAAFPRGVRDAYSRTKVSGRRVRSWTIAGGLRQIRRMEADYGRSCYLTKSW